MLTGRWDIVAPRAVPRSRAPAHDLSRALPARYPGRICVRTPCPLFGDVTMSRPAFRTYRWMPALRRGRAWPVLAALAALGLAACGGDSPSQGDPTGPTPRPDPDPDPPVVATVQVDPGSATLVPGEELQLAAALLDQAGSPVPNATATWSSTADAVVQVNAQGRATAVGVGTAEIRATSGGRTGTATLVVRDGGVASPTGTTLVAAGGVVTMEFPAGALAEDVSITVEPTASPSPDDDRVLSGLVFDFGPGGTTFAAPVTVRMAYDPDALPDGVDEAQLALYRWDGTEWTALADGAVDVAASTVSGTTTGFSVFAARTAATPSQPEPEPGRMIYLAGRGGTGLQTTGYVWVNGERSALSVAVPNGTGASAANDIAVDGDDVYVAGVTYVTEPIIASVAVYWKNGQAHPLTEGQTRAVANAIAVHDGVVHVVGHEVVNSREVATHWIDGVPHRLASASVWSDAHAITISDGEVLIAGTINDHDVVLWRDGAATALDSDGLYRPGVGGIVVSDGKVYVSASAFGQVAYHLPVYWEDGVRTNLAPLGLLLATDMAVHQGDVYVTGEHAGYDPGEATSHTAYALYWKNSELVHLTTTDANAGAIAIAANGDVHIAGSLGGRATLWVNDVPQALPSPAGSVIVRAIAIVEP